MPGDSKHLERTEPGVDFMGNWTHSFLKNSHSCIKVLFIYTRVTKYEKNSISSALPYNHRSVSKIGEPLLVETSDNVDEAKPDLNYNILNMRLSVTYKFHFGDEASRLLSQKFRYEKLSLSPNCWTHRIDNELFKSQSIIRVHTQYFIKSETCFRR